MPAHKQPRVGYVLKMYPRFSETFILNEILSHEAAGLDVRIYSLKLPIDGHFHEALARVKAPVTYLGQDGLRAVNFWDDVSKAAAKNPGVWKHLPACARIDAHEVHAAAKLGALASEHGITHLHAHFATSAATVAMLAGAMAEVPYSFTAHAKDIYIESVDHAHMRRLLRGARGVVTVSDYNVDHFQRTYGDDAAAVQRIYNGLPVTVLPYSAPQSREPRIVGVGRLVEKKGFDDLIHACAILRDRGAAFRCDIIGDGPLAGDLARLATSLRLNDIVRFLGPLPQGQVMNAVQQAAALAAPCIVGADGNRDGLPTVLLEAMALGTPCVSTDVTGITEAITHDETGLIVPQRAPVVLADGLARLLTDSALRCRLASKARARVETHFDIARNTTSLRAVFAGPVQDAPINVTARHAAGVAP